MNRFDWNKLSPDEFQRLQDYISYAPKKVKDVIITLEKDPNWLAHKYDEQVDYDGFRQFLDLLVDNFDFPEDLSRHLFLSFIKKPPIILSNENTSTIGILPITTSTLPANSTANIVSTGTQSTSTFSFLPEKFFRQKKIYR